MKYIITLVLLIAFVAVGVPLIFNHVGAWAAILVAIVVALAVINYSFNKFKIKF